MENKKQKIEDVSRKLFAEKGYKKVSMDEISFKSSITKRTIYSYFKDKDELFSVFVKEELNNMKNIIEKIENQDLSFFEKIHETIYQLLKYKKQSKFLDSLSKEADELKTVSSISHLKIINDSIQNYIKIKLTSAIENGNIKNCNVDICSFIIYKIYISIIFEYNDNLEEKDEIEIVDNITKILKTGIFN